LTLRAIDASGARVTTRCTLSRNGQVLALGDTPAGATAAGAQ
jgi:hypothetical protein